MTHLNDWTKRDLLLLPVRKWDDISDYDGVLLLGTQAKHDSGWAIMAIIGVRDMQPVEIAVQCCDDVEWKFPPMIAGRGYTIGQVRMDCCYKSKALHFWNQTRGSAFRVGHALSSITIELIEKEGI